MKDYKRLTPNSYTETIGIAQHDKVFNQAVITQAWDWENKIESGELCEQKTCKNMTEKNPVDEFICSECGFHYEDVSGTREDEDGEYSYKVEFVTKYCPNCGAKVEDEE